MCEEMDVGKILFGKHAKKLPSWIRACPGLDPGRGRGWSKEKWQDRQSNHPSLRDPLLQKEGNFNAVVSTSSSIF